MGDPAYHFGDHYVYPGNQNISDEDEGEPEDEEYDYGDEEEGYGPHYDEGGSI